LFPPFQSGQGTTKVYAMNAPATPSSPAAPTTPATSEEMQRKIQADLTAMLDPARKKQAAADAQAGQATGDKAAKGQGQG